MKKIPLVLDIGGIRSAFLGGGKFLNELSGRYSRFITSGRPDCLFELGHKEKKETPANPRIIRKNGLVRFKRGDFDCLLAERPAIGRLNSCPALQTFDSFLRTFYSWLLLREGGMLLHCAALVSNGKACLFLGKSGAGKSTLSKLAASAGIEVISDELNLLRFEKGRFQVHGSPFWGEMRNEGRQGAWPLEQIFILKKSGRHRVSASAPGEAMAILLRCLMNFSKTPEAAAASLAGAAKLLAAVPVKRLEFSKRDAGFLALLKK